MTRRHHTPARPTRSIRWKPGRIELSMTIDVDGEPDEVAAVDSALASARASIIDGIERNRLAALGDRAQCAGRSQ
jgi:hypothetical protein